MHPDGIWRKSGARPGDAVLLTKPLGTGLVLQAVRDGRAPEGALDAAVASMTELNRDAADALRSFSPNAVTDVTGFGLLGHAHETAERSGVRIALDADRAARACRARSSSRPTGTRTGGDRRNREFAGPHVESSASSELEALAYDPQTAGGLLVTLPSDKRVVLEATFAAAGLPLHHVGARRGRVRGDAVVRLSRAPARAGRRRTASCSSRSARWSSLGLVVTSGAFVRLTGSGLGCDNWPRCGSTPFPALGFHPMIEFGNRWSRSCGILASLATWLASRRVAGLPRWVVAGRARPRSSGRSRRSRSAGSR